MPSSSDPEHKISISPWAALSSERVADCRVFRVDRTKFRHPTREVEHDFFVIDSPDWVNVVAVTTGGDLVLVNQFRFGSREFSWEIPGGLIDGDEDPITAGRRELKEETGFGGGEARLLGTIRPNPAIQNNHSHFVLIEGVRQEGAQAWDEHEEIESIHLPVAEVLARARRGEITHSLTMAALFLFEPHWGKYRSGPVV